MAMYFYGTSLSLYTFKLRFALAVKGLDVEMRAPPEGYRSAAYRALVPTATIPALVDGDLVLSESDAIIEYLDELHPAASLLPGDAQRRARARMLSRLHDFRVEPPVRALLRYAAPATRDAAAIGDRFADHAAAMALVDQLARPAPFLCGAAPSLADCAFVATLVWARRLAAAFEVALPPPAWFGAWDEACRSIRAGAALLRDYEGEVERWISERVSAPPPS